VDPERPVRRLRGNGAREPLQKRWGESEIVPLVERLAAVDPVRQPNIRRQAVSLVEEYVVGHPAELAAHRRSGADQLQTDLKDEEVVTTHLC
jgi:hypothetical protein